MSPLSNLPGPWRWEKRGDNWWRVHDTLHIEDGPHQLSEEEEDAGARRGEDLLDGPADWDEDE